MKERFYVHKSSGFVLNIGSEAGGRTRPLPVGFHILDRAYCHRVIEVFPKGGKWTYPDGEMSGVQRAKATRRCAELNAWDRACDTIRKAA